MKLWVNHRRTLWRLSSAGFAVSLLGLLILFNPTLEFYAIDLIELLHLPIALFANLALFAEAALLLISTLALLTLTLQHLLRRRAKTPAP